MSARQSRRGSMATNLSVGVLAIPRAVQREAREGNEMIGNGYSGGTPTGWRRGEQLADKGYISVHDVKVMRDWFARHYYTSSPNYYRWIQDGSPIEMIRGKKAKYRGAVAYLIWGGESAYRWINTKKVQAALRRADYDATELP